MLSTASISTLCLHSSSSAVPSEKEGSARALTRLWQQPWTEDKQLCGPLALFYITPTVSIWIKLQ